MKLTLVRLLSATVLASAMASCSYNTYVEPPVPERVVTQTRYVAPRPSSSYSSSYSTPSYSSPSYSSGRYDKSASVGGGYGGGSPEGFQAVQKPSTYSH